ncbi:MAG: L-2-amino-thiazoline-4-carboxylic acid hydrolase [Candidatus Hermodarchaeota archaeon]
MMNFTHVGKCRPEILDEKIEEYQPKEFAELRLKSFDHLLGVVKTQQPEILVEYVSNLEARYQQLVKSDYLTLRAADVSPLLTELTQLREHPKLARLYLNYNYQLLQLAKKTKWKTAKVKIILRTFMRARYIPIYTNLQVLTETFPRAKAIQLFKHHINDYIQCRIADLDDRFKTLEELREMLLKMEEWGVVGNVGEVKDGKLIMRRDTCLHHALLADIPDEELKFLTCCYGDYEGVRGFNKHFKLTMSGTLVAGDPYCDCVYYDTRITKDFTHPPKAFFESIWPLADNK